MSPSNRVRYPKWDLPRRSRWAARLVLLAGMLFVCGSAHAEEARPCGDEAFARALMAERDYFRAIGEFKWLAHCTSEESERVRYRYAVGQAYRLSGKYEHAMAQLAESLATPDVSAELASRIHLQLAVASVGSHATAQALAFVDRAIDASHAPLAQLVSGVIAAEGSDWTTARRQLVGARDSGQGRRIGTVASTMLQHLDDTAQMRHRSPWLAGAMSLLVPGAGQLYTGHAVDAAQAFAFVGIFGFSSFIAERYESSRAGSYPLTVASLAITGVLHAANVVGAVRTARYFNQRELEKRVTPLRNQLLAIEF